jgi:hypothetical protein
MDGSHSRIVHDGLIDGEVRQEWAGGNGSSKMIAIGFAHEPLPNGDDSNRRMGGTAINER